MVHSKTSWLWLGMARFGSRLVFVVLRYIFRYRYQTILGNLSRSFPAKTPAQVSSLLENYYHHLSDLCVEPFLFALASAELRNHLVRFTNPHVLQQLHQDQKPVVLLASHYGNWEYLIQLPLYSPYPVYTAYSPPRTLWVDRLLLRLRRRFGVHLIPQAIFYRSMLARSSQAAKPALMVLIADQRPGPASLKHQLLFLGQPTYVQLGAERLASKLDAATVLLDCTKVSRFCYAYCLNVVGGTAKSGQPMFLTQRYYQHLEEQIYRSPTHWLWSHNRWKALDSHHP